MSGWRPRLNVRRPAAPRTGVAARGPRLGRLGRLGMAGVVAIVALAVRPTLASPAEATEPSGPSESSAPPQTDAQETGKPVAETIQTESGGDELGESDRGASPARAPGLQTRLEAAMTELGRMASGAKSDSDAARATCVLDKQERGQTVMEVATGELLVIGDANASARQKSFAVEKLEAAADRLERIVDEARTCTGDQAPEDEDDLTRTELDETETVPVADPTRGGSTSPVPPPVDDHTPVSVASPAA